MSDDKTNDYIGPSHDTNQYIPKLLKKVTIKDVSPYNEKNYQTCIANPNIIKDKMIDIITKSLELNTKIKLKPCIIGGILKGIRNRNNLKKTTQRRTQRNTQNYIQKIKGTFVTT